MKGRIRTRQPNADASTVASFHSNGIHGIELEMIIYSAECAFALIMKALWKFRLKSATL